MNVIVVWILGSNVYQVSITTIIIIIVDPLEIRFWGKDHF